MDRPHRRTVRLLSFVLLLSAAWFLAGITWGLPSRDADRFLFGDRTPWTGADIAALASPDSGATRAADVDANPLDRSRTSVVNETDRQRAEIVRRYRLFSNQPDEMQTFMALKEMKPGSFDLDPKFYKYGGLWVYPVGAILKVGSIVGLIDVRADLTHYLDHPDAFGRFYVAARLYTVAWALVGVWAIFHLARHISGDRIVAGVAALSFAAMPAVVNAAHEAKPHLPGVVLSLLAVIAAARYVRWGTMSAVLVMGVACGAAIAMVPSALPVVLVVPVATLLRPMTWSARLGAVGLAAGATVAVYVLTNPYVPINAFRRPELLKSHFSNSADFYHLGGSGAFQNGMLLLVAGMSPLLAAGGVMGALILAWSAARRAMSSLTHVRIGEGGGEGRGFKVRRSRNDPSRTDPPEDAVCEVEGDSAPGRVRFSGRASSRRHKGRPLKRTLHDSSTLDDDVATSGKEIAYLLAAPAIVGLIQFFAFAAGQPGDYGRFALLPDVVLALAAVCVVGRGARHSQVRLFLLGTMLLTTVAAGAIYVASFVRDASGNTTRLQVAGELDVIARQGATRLATPIEPAPFSLPAVDLWKWRIQIPPRGQDAEPPPGGIAVRPLDAPGDSWLHLWFAPRLCWASKSFAVDYDLTPATGPTTGPVDAFPSRRDGGL